MKHLLTQFAVIRSFTHFASISCVVLLLLADRVDASIFNVGESVSTESLYPDIGTVYTSPIAALVGPCVELPGSSTNFGGGNYFDIDFFADEIEIRFNATNVFSAVSFNGLHIFNTPLAQADITGVTINPATNMVGLDASRITFDANNIYINWEGLPFSTAPRTIVSLDLTSGLSDVPEPSSMVLAGLGVVGLIVATHRRRKS